MKLSDIFAFLSSIISKIEALSLIIGLLGIILVITLELFNNVFHSPAIIILLLIIVLLAGIVYKQSKQL